MPVILAVTGLKISPEPYDQLHNREKVWARCFAVLQLPKEVRGIKARSDMFEKVRAESALKRHRWATKKELLGLIGGNAKKVLLVAFIQTRTHTTISFPPYSLH